MSRVGYIKTADGVYHMIASSGGTKDIINGIMTADKDNAAYVAEFVKTIPGENLEDVCANLWKFLKENIPYQEDPDGFQFIQSPGWLYKNRSTGTGGTGKGGDCKSYSNFISGCLKCLGIKHFYRFISEDANDELHHVYICVPTGIGSEYIVMDAVLDEFDKEVNYVKKEDRWADMKTAKAAISGPRQAHMDGSQQEDYDKAASWAYEEEKLKDKFFRDKEIKEVRDLCARDLIQRWKNVNHIKYGAFRSKLVNNDEGFESLLTGCAVLIYKWWDTSKAPFIDPITRTLTIELDKKMNYLSQEVYNSLTEKIGLRDFTIRKLCNLAVFKVYGITLDHMLDRCYNMVNYGQPWGPVNGVPYFDFNKKQFIHNGADLSVAKKIELCLPYDGGVTRCEGVPYWCHYGFVMKNGALSQADSKGTGKLVMGATLEDWMKKNPRPTNQSGIWKKSPTAADKKYFTEQCIPAYADWLAGNSPGLPPAAKPTGGIVPGSTGKPSMSGPEIGYIPVAEITAILVIIAKVLAILSTIVGLVLGLIEAFKKPNQKTDIAAPPTDFHMEFQAVDGTYIGVAPAECGELKAKFYPQTGEYKCLTPDELKKDPRNQPGMPPDGHYSLSTGGNTKMILMGGAALLGAGILLSDSK